MPVCRHMHNSGMAGAASSSGAKGSDNMCEINMCGPGCWKLLHGYYKVGEEPDEKAATFRGPGKKKPDAAAAAAEEEEEE